MFLDYALVVVGLLLHHLRTLVVIQVVRYFHHLLAPLVSHDTSLSNHSRHHIYCNDTQHNHRTLLSSQPLYQHFHCRNRIHRTIPNHRLLCKVVIRGLLVHHLVCTYLQSGSNYRQSNPGILQCIVRSIRCRYRRPSRRRSFRSTSRYHIPRSKELVLHCHQNLNHLPQAVIVKISIFLEIWHLTR